MKKSEGRNPSDSSAAAKKPQENTVQQQGYTMSQDPTISVPENVILQTTNYSMFKFDPLNRAIRQDKLDRLYDAVQKKDLLHLFPIVVSRTLVVIDGQHRLKTAESLGLPIYYIVSSQMRIEDAAFVNTNTDNWRMADYLDHWCKVGLPDYIQFRDFLEANRFINSSTLMKLMTYGEGGQQGRSNPRITLAQVFREGRFKITNISLANRVISMAKDFQRWVPFWRMDTFIIALATLAMHRNYDHERMMTKMEYLSVRLVKCADVKGYLQIFEELYNHKVSLSNRVKFGSNKIAHRQ